MTDVRPLETVIADWRGDAAVLRARGHAQEARLDRLFSRLRIDALRELAAEGHEASAVRLRWELNERRLDAVNDLRLNLGELEYSRERYRPIGSRLRALIFRYYGRKCGICHRIDGFFEIDHKLPYSRGGRHEWDNLWVLCAPCNRDKGTNTVQEYLLILKANANG